MEQLTSIMLGYIATQYGITEDAAAELLFESSESDAEKQTLKTGALDALLSLDQERVTTLKDSVDTTESFKNGYDKARKEVLAKEEKKLAKQYGIEDTSLKLDKLVASIVAKSTPEGDDLEDKVKTHPLYLELERNSATSLDEAKTAYETKITELEAGHAKKETMRTVSGEILSLFDGLNPILSSDTTRAGNQRTDFAQKFEKYDFELQEDKTYLVTSEGKRIEDGHGHPISLSGLVEREAGRYFDFKAQSEKEGTGNGSQAGGSGSGAIEVPADEAAYNEAVFSATTAEERAAITEAYEAASGS